MINTEIIREINSSNIKKAAEIIKKGGTVIFPTETVYGLGANGLDEEACKKIFQAKGRPSDNPLILHISSMEQLDKIVKEIPESARKLADKFWPGPLTIIFEKSPIVGDIISAGLNTVAVRMPNNEIALELIRLSGCPIAAPSANTSGKPSPTNVDHVIEDMNGRVDMIIDGGQCNIGLESTVLDLTGDCPTILRPGGVTKEQIQEVLGSCEYDIYLIKSDENIVPKSPGQKYRHYSPKAELILYKGSLSNMVDNIVEDCKRYQDIGKKVGILATEQTKNTYENGTVLVVGDREKPSTIANKLFHVLREFDSLGVDIILAESFENVGLGKAIMNRIEKAASKIK